MPTFVEVACVAAPVFLIALIWGSTLNNVKTERDMNRLIKDLQEEEKAAKKLARKNAVTAKTVEGDYLFEEPTTAQQGSSLRVVTRKVAPETKKKHPRTDSQSESFDFDDVPERMPDSALSQEEIDAFEASLR